MKCFVAIAATVLLCATTGCHLCGSHGACGSSCDSGCDAPVACDSCDSCNDCSSGCCGSGGGLVGLFGCFRGSSCSDCNSCSSCSPGVTPETLNQDGYGVHGGYSGPMMDHLGQFHRGPQSHMGPLGPAGGPHAPTVTYPYYTTRGPRDYFAANPPSIGP